MSLQTLWIFCLNLSAITYCLVGYLLGNMVLVTHDSLFFNLIGMLLLSHTMVYSVLLYHEFSHSTIFKKESWLNHTFAALVLFVNGGHYFTFDELRKQHWEHHVRPYEKSYFDVNDMFSNWRLATVVRMVVTTSERCLVPAATWWYEWRAILSPLWSKSRSHLKTRLAVGLSLRLTQYVPLYRFGGIKALVLYFLSYWIFTHLRRIIDFMTHEYPYIAVEKLKVPFLSKAFDQRHTFSPLIQDKRFSWLNAVLFLNFGYHNAHHFNTTVSWHELPAFHEQMAATHYSKQNEETQVAKIQTVITDLELLVEENKFSRDEQIQKDVIELEALIAYMKRDVAPIHQPARTLDFVECVSNYFKYLEKRITHGKEAPGFANWNNKEEKANITEMFGIYDAPLCIADSIQ